MEHFPSTENDVQKVYRIAKELGIGLEAAAITCDAKTEVPFHLNVDRLRQLTYYFIMANEYRAVVKHDNGWWIGWIEEVPGVNCQEATRDELLESLRITLGEALDFNREDARRMAGTAYEHALIAA